MAQYQIFLLPLLALLIAILFPIFDKDIRQSSSLKSRRRRRTLLGRFTVVALLLATVITEIWPTAGVMPLFQGALVTILLLLPVCIVIWFLTRRYDNDRTGMVTNGKKSSNNTTVPAANNSTLPTQPKPISSRPRIPDLAPVPQKKTISKSPENTKIPQSLPDAEDDVQVHLGRVSNVIQSYDLDDTGFTSPETKGQENEARKNRDQLVADSTALATVSEQTTDLAKLDNNQITQLVTTLRKDKKRLQKLVIAQQAAIHTERDAHEKTRVLTRDAISVMRSARTAQKHAEKLARRERSERQRLEQQYKKVAYELSNALSIVEERTAAQASNEPLSALETPQMSDKILF